MNEQDIVKTFKVKKLLTVKEFAEIKDLTQSTASLALKALCNKGVMDKITTVQNDEEYEYYYLVEDTAEVKQTIQQRFRKENNKKTNKTNSKRKKELKIDKTGSFYGNLVSLLDKDVVVLLTNGEARRGTLKSFEPNHLSIFITDCVDGTLVMIRGNAIVVLREVKKT